MLPFDFLTHLPAVAPEVGLTILALTIGAALAARWLADRFSLEVAR